MVVRLLFALVCLPLASRAASDLLGFYDGPKTITVHIHVLDSVAKTPVADAEIWLVTGEQAQIYRRALKHPKYRKKLAKPIEELGSRIRSDSDGQATIQSDFHAIATVERDDGEEKTEGTWRVEGRISICAAGYEDYVADLEDLAPKRAHDLSETATNFVIDLKRRANKPVDPTPGDAPRSSGGQSQD